MDVNVPVGTTGKIQHSTWEKNTRFRRLCYLNQFVALIWHYPHIHQYAGQHRLLREPPPANKRYITTEITRAF